MFLRFRGFVLSLALLCWLVSSSQATKFWKDSVPSGNWSTGDNWSAVSAAGADNGGAPVASEPVNIVHTNGVAHTVTLFVNTPSLGLLAIDLTGAGAATNTLSMSNHVGLTAAGIYVGGHNGTGFTAGRGTLTQSAGTISTSPGTDLYIALGTGSTGIYNLSGGALNANLSTVVGSFGTGTFNHSGGTHTLLPEAIGGALLVGYQPGSNGNYNLSGTGQLISNKHEIIGVEGNGTFTQTGGTNTIAGGFNLVLGNSAGSQGLYSITGGTLTVGNNVTVGNGGAGTLNINGTGTVSIANNLAISSAGTVNLTNGTLRFNTVTGLNRLNWISGTLQLAGDRNLNVDPTLSHYFGFEPTIGVGRKVVVEGASTLDPSLNFSVNGGSFTSLGEFIVNQDNSAINTLNFSNGATVVTPSTRLAFRSFGNSQFPKAIANVSGAGTTWNTGSLEVGLGGVATLNVTDGAAVTSSEIGIGEGVSLVDEPSTAAVSGPGSSLRSNSNMFLGKDAILTIDDSASVYVTTDLNMSVYSSVNLNGGTLRFNSLTRADVGDPNINPKVNYNGGTMQLAGSRTLGSDAIIQEFYGAFPTISLGKGLTVEGAATLTKPVKIDGGTLTANGLSIGAGGSLLFQSGALEISGGTITGLAQLNIPTSGEFRASGTQSVRVVGAAGSTITATGNLFLGDNTVVNGFATQGTLNVGANLVSLFDANDAVLDSTSFTTLGAGGNPGTLDSFYGITLNFGGNITGYGTISTLGTITEPLINNGHILGNSAAQRITLPGYVKGVGTFDNVTFTGTFAPGLSPTSLVVGSIGLANTSTLLMELGGTAPGSGYDQILASGLLSLDGALQLSLINGFSPAAGQSFNLFDWTSASGTFDNLLLPTLSGGLSWNTSQLYTTGLLSISAGIPGDFDFDGDVDGRDFLTWQRGNSPSPLSTSDLTDWQANYGAGALSALSDFNGGGTPPANAVPEPGTLLLGLLGIYPLSRRKR
jgi:autotransporter family porin